MNLSDEQNQTIAQKLSEGASIADVQRLITDEFKVPITYMETRFLIDDLDLDLVDNSPKEPEVDDSPEAVETAPNEAAYSDAELVGNGVSVEIDRVKRPGAALSGDVTFSDGKKAKWYVDPMGRLGLDPEEEGYQPSAEDIQAFQVELQQQMQGPGI